MQAERKERVQQMVCYEVGDRRENESHLADSGTSSTYTLKILTGSWNSRHSMKTALVMIFITVKRHHVLSNTYKKNI